MNVIHRLTSFTDYGATWILGVINVASEVDGAQIGLVNISKNGRIQAEAFATGTMPINLGVRFVSGYSYSEVAVGYDPVARDNQYSGGLGAHFDIARMTLEAGVHGSSTQHAETSVRGRRRTPRPVRARRTRSRSGSAGRRGAVLRLE